MFKINPSPTFRAKVPLSVPGAEAASVIEFEFRHKGRTAFSTWWKSAQERKDDEALSDIIVSWDGVIDDKGEAVAYSTEALALLLDNYPAAIMEIFSAYVKALSESRKKN